VLSRAALVVGLCVAGLASAIFAGYKLGTRRPAAGKASASDGDLGLDEFRRELRELRESNVRLQEQIFRMAADLRAPSKSAAAEERRLADAANDRGPPQVSPKALETMRAGQEIIDRALVAGTWTEADRDKIHVIMATAPIEARKELVKSLIDVGNSGRLKFRLIGPPF